MDQRGEVHPRAERRRRRRRRRRGAEGSGDSHRNFVLQKVANFAKNHEGLFSVISNPMFANFVSKFF